MQIEDIIETQNRGPRLLWWEQLGLLLAGILVLSLIIYFVVKLCKKQNLGSSIDPAEVAKKAFSQLQKSQHTARELSRLASFILRDYLKSKFNTPALFQTIEEFQLTRDELAYFPVEVRDSITSFLCTASELTYSPNPGLSVASDKLIAQGIALVDSCESTSVTLQQSTEPQPSTHH